MNNQNMSLQKSKFLSLFFVVSIVYTNTCKCICRNINEDTIVHQRYEPPARPIPPPGVEDFDLLNWNDPNQCAEYAMDIFYYYKSREVPYYVHNPE